MSSIHVPTPAARQAAASPHATLAQLVTLAGRHAMEQLTPMTARMSAVLADLSEPGPDPQTIRLRVKSGRLLKDNAYAFFHLASTAIDAALQRELAPLASAAANGPGASSSLNLSLNPGLNPGPALSLVSLDEMDSRLALATLAKPFDLAHAAALATLSVRLGALLARPAPRADANPFRPAVLLGALSDAWRAFEPDPDAHGLFADLLRPELVFDLGPLYAALNLALGDALRAKNGHAADDAARFQKTDDGAAAKAARAAARSALAARLRALFGDDGGDDGVPLIPDLPMLAPGAAAVRGGWRPSGAAGDPAAGVPAAGVPAAAAAAGFAVPAAGASAPGAPNSGAPVSGAPSSGAPNSGAPFFGAPAGAPAAGSPAAGTPGFHPGGFALAGVPAANGAAGHASGFGSLLDVLARIEGGSGQAWEAGVAAAPAQASAPHQVFYLPRLRQSLPQGSLPRRDERTLDLLSRVFETVLLDDAIPAPTRELLQLLQVPVLKAALVDRNFFFEETHPARRLVDLLSRMGWAQGGPGQNAEDGAMLQAMRRSVERVAQGVADPGQDAGRNAGQDPGLVHFAAAVAELEASLAADDAAREAALATPVAAALKQEQRASARRAAQDAVALRLAGGGVEDAGTIGAAVGQFLQQRWTTVLTFAYSIDASKPGAVDSATRAMDDLIWSIQPKATPEGRKRLIARLPRLLAMLNQWLDAIGWQDAERLAFFARLADCHAAIVRAPVELAPERQFELAIEAAQQDALRKAALEQAAADQAAARRAETSPLLDALDGLERGMWFEFTRNEKHRKVKLAWVSPLRTLFIFSGAGRQEAFSLAADKLAEALRGGTARVLAVDGVVGQVLADAMGQGPGGGPASLARDPGAAIAAI